MKRWEILVWFLVIFTLVLGGYYLWSQKTEEKKVVRPTVNTNARLAASGSPLPAVADEDLLVEQQQLDGNVFQLFNDYETGNWQLEFFQNGVWQKLRYIDTSDQFFYWNPIDLVWDEVAAALLHEDILKLTDIEQFLFTETQLSAFNQAAIEEDSKPCKQDRAIACAVWYAYNPDAHQETLIYVNKQTRKIDHIITLNAIDKTQTALIANYFYQPVNIQPPPKKETRYLP